MISMHTLNSATAGHQRHASIVLLVFRFVASWPMVSSTMFSRIPRIPRARFSSAQQFYHSCLVHSEWRICATVGKFFGRVDACVASQQFLAGVTAAHQHSISNGSGAHWRECNLLALCQERPGAACFLHVKCHLFDNAGSLL